MRAAVLALSLALIGGPAIAQTAASEADYALDVKVVARGLEHPWGLAFLPDGRMLVTERPGRLRLIERDGRVLPALAGVPAVAAVGQGGLLGIALDPRFAENRLVYLSFAERRSGDTNATAVYRGRLNLAGTGLEAGRVIYRQEPAFAGRLHFGSRLVFDRSGALFVTLGERFQLPNESQNPANAIGKIVRITTDGAPAAGNPGANRPGWNAAIWSIGHRNVQGAALHPQTGELWISNHGPRGGDGLYVVRAGRNYGWPLISYGTHYDGRPVNGGATAAEGLEQPLVHWTPSIAPSGLTFYTGDLFQAWRGNIISGALAGQMLVRVVLDGERVIAQRRYLTDFGQRFRDVLEGPDGALWALTDSAEGQLVTIRPRGR
ncbi:PQQ-dependent sugar dehydrogenase [Phreatobacter stygius]|uniref:PQQ-dependent sugar dehydrogenase n=1 Tax=Phreatobacter stygius TaxID=1940610 RepID=A0A4D7AXV0_9HYPH|nr:PQQ-dependent sugar dehydrogenase [Phreatobacter stygius]QCI63713.1 PQQ-dependent sugar dehydrogenase [Phreatobacter stygius]